MQSKHPRTAMPSEPIWRQHRHRFGLLLLLFLIATDAAHAQVQPPRSVNYSYGAILGTGVYRLDDRTVGILRVPFSKRFREPTMTTFGIKLLLPVTFGVHRYESDTPADIAGDRFASLSFVPGLELQYLARPNWAVKPFAHAGLGLEIDDRDTDAIWGLGVRTVAKVRQRYPQVSVGVEWLTASNNPNDDDLDDHFTRFGGGIDFRFPLKMTIGERTTSITAQLNIYDYVNEVELGVQGGTSYQIGWTAEIGAALGLDPPLSLFGFKVDRLGLGFRFGEDLRGIYLVRKFPF
jgi:hypothetical protein